MNSRQRKKWARKGLLTTFALRLADFSTAAKSVSQAIDDLATSIVRLNFHSSCAALVTAYRNVPSYLLMV